MNFERGQDPKSAIEIGLFRERIFDTFVDAETWLMQNHTKILGIDGLCNPYPSSDQIQVVMKYAEKYIRIVRFGKLGPSIIIDGLRELYIDLNRSRK